MAGAARAKSRPRTLQERIAELTARAAKEKKRKDLKDTIANARKELQSMRRK